MNRRTAMGGALLLWATVGMLSAQEKDRGPVVLPKGAASWTVTVIDPEKKSEGVTEPQNQGQGQSPVAPPSAAVVRIETVQTPKARCDTFVWSDGRTSQAWYVDGYVLRKTAEGDDVYVGRGSGGVSAAPGEWFITPGTFGWTAQVVPDKGERYSGKAALYFVRGEGAGTETVYANPETLLPLAAIEDGKTYEFTFGAPPTSEPVMPALFAKALQEIKLANTPMTRVSRDPSSR